MQNEKFKDLYSKIRDDLVRQIYNEGININNLAQTLNMDEDELCDYLSLRKTDYLAYKTIDTAIKKKVR